MAVPWDLLQYDVHRKLQVLVTELNRLYRSEPALYEVDFHYTGFEWIDFHDAENSIIAFLRRAEDGRFRSVLLQLYSRAARELPFRCARGGILRRNPQYRLRIFGGSNMGNGGLISTEPTPCHGRPLSLVLTLPPLAVIAFRLRR